MDKIYRRKTQSSGTVKKKKDEKKRKRNQIINFRVSPMEKKLIEKRIEISGLSKSDFFIESCLYQKILVKGNIKTFDRMKEHLDQLEKQLQISEDLADMEPELIEAIRIIFEIIGKLYGNNDKRENA